MRYRRIPLEISKNSWTSTLVDVDDWASEFTWFRSPTGFDREMIAIGDEFFTTQRRMT